ncbi:UDP-glucuronosyltransferase 2A3-like isoform X3 [Eriocheir sinensis]|uniref:UDP-glucuronosyltransferase 2A3-like isoform X3 n=1 Tax=Eriocheir sinensis TaxID=95602 RepID=UPI0021C64C78|nr:UDP-glucuronosyltransferase 2A3-like isoform X3 [Eriocheir sinensis]
MDIKLKMPLLVSGRKGFMGTYFIRPPLDITVVFPVPIDISYIKLVARLEQKCSTGFLIFTEPEDISCQHQQAHPRKASKPGIPSTSHSGHSSPSCAPSHDPPKPLTTSPDGDSDIYFCVGQFYTKAEDELVLTNHHYRHWLRLPMPNANGNVKDPRVFRGSLRHSNRKALKCVKSVIIRIQSTAERGPPVLRSLEVWGQPGISTKKLRRRELLREWSAFKPLAQSEPVVPRLYNSYPEEKKIQKPGLEALRNNDLLEVPEDFLDPLTCDVMTVPLLLPSGNSIDAHTLERFIASEGTWGRPASDPFTGVPFRGDKQPVPNVPLKARIDRFLLANGEHPEVEKCGRTVGSSLSTSEATPGTSTSVAAAAGAWLLLLLGTLGTCSEVNTTSHKPVNATKSSAEREEGAGRRILILHPMYAASHVLTLRALARSLVARGHQVTVVRWKDTHQYPAARLPGITEFVLAINNTDGAVPHVTAEERGSFVMPQEVMWSSGTSWSALPVDAFITVSTYCRTLLEDLPLRHHLRQQEFHVAIVDLIYNECSLALAHDLGVPAIGYWAFTFAGGEPQYTTAFSPPSSVPFILSHYQDAMTFKQRAVNHLHALASHLVMQIQFGITGYHISRLLPSCPPPATLLADISGMLINSHPALDYPRLLPPSFINVGGLQIQPPSPLPKELEEWLAGSGEAGTILFSMGFIFNPRTVPLEVIRSLMDAFARLPQRVLMKLEEPHPAVPPNVKVVNWVPQQDVLGHPKTVLFFTHCGMHGVLEGLHYGVPMVGMPVFADQQDVLVRLEERGVARGVSKQANEDQIYEALKDVLTNTSYRANARRLSRIIKHHPLDPLRHAQWLVEHVAATGGAQHLKFASRHLNFVQFFGLDVAAFAVAAALALWYLLLPVLRHLITTLLSVARFRSKTKIKMT